MQIKNLYQYILSVLSFLDKSKTKVFFLTTILVTFSFVTYRPLRLFFSNNPTPYIIPNKPKAVASNRSAVAQVTVGMHIINFNKFDTTANEFIANLIVWFEFNPSLISLSAIEKFSFDRGEILHTSKPYIKNLKNEKLLARYTVRVKFSTNLDHTYFPLNGHTIFIVLHNEETTTDELIFFSQKNNLVLSEGLHTEDWIATDKNVNTGHFTVQLGHMDKETQYPRAIFSIDFKRSGLRKFLLIFIPILMFFFLGLLSLIMNVNDNKTISLSMVSSSLTGLLAYRFVIDGISPAVGYFNITDYLFNIILCAVFIFFLITLMDIHLKKNKTVVLYARVISFYGMQIITLYAWYSLIQF